MIIDQLPLLLGDALLTDEFPIERGTTSYKAKLEQILGVAFSAIDTKQDKITASGVLKGNGSAVSAATLGTDYGARSFSITLAAADWSSNEQTVTSVYFLAAGYCYIVSPASSSFADYASAVIYADDVTSAGQMTFHCTETPSTDLTVNVIRVVSA